MKQEENEIQRREHYRINYPLVDRPSIEINNKVYEVIDLAEEGIKFYCPAKEVLPLSDHILFHLSDDSQEDLSAEGAYALSSEKQLIFTPNNKSIIEHIKAKESLLKDNLIKIRISGLQLPISSFTEKQLFCQLTSDLELAALPNLMFKLIFHDKEPIMSEGKILRIQKHKIVLKINIPIPSQKIVSEQVFLARKYPDRKDRIL
jgi:hypothetical protein